MNIFDKKINIILVLLLLTQNFLIFYRIFLRDYTSGILPEVFLFILMFIFSINFAVKFFFKKTKHNKFKANLMNVFLKLEIIERKLLGKKIIIFFEINRVLFHKISKDKILLIFLLPYLIFYLLLFFELFQRENFIYCWIFLPILFLYIKIFLAFINYSFLGNMFFLYRRMMFDDNLSGFYKSIIEIYQAFFKLNPLYNCFEHDSKSILNAWKEMSFMYSFYFKAVELFYLKISLLKIQELMSVFSFHVCLLAFMIRINLLFDLQFLVFDIIIFFFLTSIYYIFIKNHFNIIFQKNIRIRLLTEFEIPLWINEVKKVYNIPLYQDLTYYTYLKKFHKEFPDLVKQEFKVDFSLLGTQDCSFNFKNK